MLSDVTKSNAERDNLSLQATTSSGLSHFRKTHLKQREVVMSAGKYFLLLFSVPHKFAL